MEILISGVSGFLGNYIYNSLLNIHNVIGISNSKNTFNNSIYKVDLTSEDETDNFLKINSNKNIDLIIHFAFKYSNDFETFLLNNKISKNITKISNHFKPKTFFNISSIRVYENSDITFNENSPTNVFKNEDFYYGLAKKCSEEIIKFNSNPYTKVINLRLAQVYDLKFENSNLFKEFKNQLQNSNKIEIWGNGKRGSCFIFIKKFEKKLLKLINQEFSESQEINLGEENILYKDIAKKIIKLYGNENSKIVYKSYGISSRVKIDLKKINKILNE